MRSVAGPFVLVAKQLDVRMGEETREQRCWCDAGIIRGCEQIRVRYYHQLAQRGAGLEQRPRSARLRSCLLGPLGHAARCRP